MEGIFNGGARQIAGGAALALGMVIIICNLGGLWNEFSSIGMWFYKNSILAYGVSTFMAVVGGFFYFKKYWECSRRKGGYRDPTDSDDAERF